MTATLARHSGRFALIAMLLLRFLQLKAKFGWATSNPLALLHQQLFVYR